ncbi:MAG TPA: ATP-dependent Clp protease proteolytic subunit, partial [Gammaproteobacteria bacterium]|nr:ATP-dependent Clp protease proteolytic subunit [Gammaproteobacteria bacterium]
MHSYQDEDSKDNKNPSRSGFMDEKLFKSRSITIFGNIDDKLARSVTERLLALAVDGDEPISLYISSPG